MNPVEIEMIFRQNMAGMYSGSLMLYEENRKNTACESDPER